MTSCPSSGNPSFHRSTWCERPCFSPLWCPLDPFLSFWNKHLKIWKCHKWHFLCVCARNHRKLCALYSFFSSTPFEESQMYMIRPTFLIKGWGILWLTILNHEFSDVQAGFRKDRGTRDQIANIHWIIEKAREFQKGERWKWSRSIVSDSLRPQGL